MVLELLIFAISIVAVISSVDFTSKSISSLADRMGVPKYLVSTIILSIIVSLPAFLAMIYSNLFNVPTLGFSTLIGFSIGVLTIVMGIILIKDEVPIEYERYRNATFMWAATILFFVVSLDQLIDRMDALFLLALFLFYGMYVYYRTKNAKEYTYTKGMPFNKVLLIPAIATIIISVFACVAAISIMSYNFVIPSALFSLTIFGTLLALPLIDLTKIFKAPILTFDSVLGSIVVTLTLIPAIAALVKPIPYNLNYNYGFLPLLFLSIISLSFAISTRLKSKIHKKTGIALLASYVVYILLILFS